MSDEKFGKYEIRGILGEGAMGRVLDAFDPVIERRAALKIVRRPAAGDAEGAEAMARFRREAQAAGRLNHPNIVAVYDYGEDERHAWIAMELVAGGSLKEMLERDERLPMPKILQLMEQILAALDYSHKRGVVHRDIKPANIMLGAEGPGDVQVKIADFGIARIENSSMTQVGTVMGTPSYMAPEQLRGETVDSRADIWAAGVLLYQLVTGEKPFSGGYSSVQHKAINTEPTPPTALSVTAPPGIDGVVARAMAKRPDGRFATAAEFADALRAAMAAGAPAAARAPAPPVDPDATVLATTTTARPAAAPSPPTAAPAAKGPPVALIGGGVALLVAAGAAFLFLGGQPTPPVVQPPPNQITQVTPPINPPLLLLIPPDTSQRPVTPPPNTTTIQPPVTPLTTTTGQPPVTPLTTTTGQPPLVTPPLTTTTIQPPVVTPPLSTMTILPPVVTPPLSTMTTQPPVVTPPQSTTTTQRPVTPLTTTTIQPPVVTPPTQLALVQPALPNFAAAATALATAPLCGLFNVNALPNALTVEGVLRRGDDVALRRLLAARDIPAQATRLALQGFDGPYCPALEALRPVLAATGQAPRVSLIGFMPLLAGQLLRLDVTMPEWPAHLYVAYFMQSGEVANLVPSATHPPGSTVRLGEPRAGFPGWEVSEPFGTDLLVAVVSEGPLFGAPRPDVEPQTNYVAALNTALGDAKRAGRRVLIRPFVVETAAR